MRLLEPANAALLAEVAALWRRSCSAEPLDAVELASALEGCRVFSERVNGDLTAAVAFAQGSGEAAHRGNIGLLVVAPEQQRRGRARSLLGAAEAELGCRGVTSVRLAGGVPRYLWPGIDRDNDAAQALALSAGYRVLDEPVNMSLATDFRAPQPPGIGVYRSEGAITATVLSFVTDLWPLWETEVSLAADRGTLFAAWAEDRPVGFVAHSTMRTGWIGPQGTDPAFRRSGIGRALLSAVCEDLAQRGHTRTDIAWVGPVDYFATLGASVNRRFVRYIKE